MAGESFCKEIALQPVVKYNFKPRILFDHYVANTVKHGGKFQCYSALAVEHILMAKHCMNGSRNASNHKCPWQINKRHEDEIFMCQ